MYSGVLIYLILFQVTPRINCATNCKGSKCKLTTKEKLSLESSDVKSQLDKLQEVNPDMMKLQELTSDLSGIYNNSAVGLNDEPVYSGDILVTDEMKQYLNSSEEDYGGATLSEKTRWPNAKVFYFIDRSVSHISGLIQEGMKKWSAFTCIRFERVLQPKPESNYVRIARTGRGCFAVIGKAMPGQIFSLDATCETLNIVTHELGHILGLWHEHTRKDRDSHMNVHLENVAPSQRLNYDIPIDFTSGSTPYDFGSIMHYDFNAFSYNRRFTMVPKNPLDEMLMQNSNKPSFYDYKIINVIYNCLDPCKNSALRCKNDGFVTSNSIGKCICVCHDDYTGNLCEQTVQRTKCGGKLTSEGAITMPDPFSPKWKCVFWLQAPPKKRVQIGFVVFNLPNCKEEYVLIRNQEIFGDDPGHRFCSDSLENKRLTSADRDMVITLKTGSDNNKSKFRAIFKFV